VALLNLIPLVGLGLAQLLLFLERLARTRRRPETINVIMGDVTPRLLVSHSVILGGGFLFIFLEDPLAGLVAMVLAKMTIDLVAFVREREIEPETRRAPSYATAEDPILAEQFKEPMLQVGGRIYRFRSFPELQRSGAFRRYLHLPRLAGEDDKLARSNTPWSNGLQQSFGTENGDPSRRLPTAAPTFT